MTYKVSKRVSLALLASLFSAAVCQAAETPILLNGAGATFPYPLYSKWFSDFGKKDSGVQVNYQSIGSGGGIKQFMEGTVDFGASDAPMTDEQLAKAPAPIVHIPTVLGAVVITYNVPGIEKGLKLSPEIVADVFMGKIAKWNDPQIAKINPSAKLPDTAILVVHRSDGSGTSGIFTDYLSKVSPEWKQKVGSGTAVNWPTGLGGKGNEGVTGLIKNTPGGIGYVELVFAEKNSLPYASLRNHAGQYIIPSTASVTAAAAGALKTLPEDFRVSITNPDGKDSYPISGFTYLLVHQSLAAPKGEKIVKLLKWIMSDGQKDAAPMSYAPLPTQLVKKVEARIAKLAPAH